MAADFSARPVTAASSGSSGVLGSGRSIWPDHPPTPDYGTGNDPRPTRTSPWDGAGRPCDRSLPMTAGMGSGGSQIGRQHERTGDRTHLRALPAAGRGVVGSLVGADDEGADGQTGHQRTGPEEPEAPAAMMIRTFGVVGPDDPSGTRV